MSSSRFGGASRGGTPRTAPALSRQLLIGAVLAVSAALLILVGSALDLDLEAVVLLGVAVGAVVALVPDATPAARLAGFAGGVVAAWLGYLARAALLPDTAGGRAVAILLVVGLCLGVVALGMGRLPLWAALLGTGGLVGTYEATFTEAPPLVLDTSIAAVTALLLCAALGWVVGIALAPRGETGAEPRVPGTRRAHDSETTQTDTHTDATSSLEEVLR